MKTSNDRILTTHVGSIPPPHDLLDELKLKIDSDDRDPAGPDAQITTSVGQMVDQQVSAGIGIGADGEPSSRPRDLYRRTLHRL